MQKYSEIETVRENSLCCCLCLCYQEIQLVRCDYYFGDCSVVIFTEFLTKNILRKKIDQRFDQKILTKNIYGNKWIKTCLTDSGLLPYSAMQHLCGTQTDLITTQILRYPICLYENFLLKLSSIPVAK